MPSCQSISSTGHVPRDRSLFSGFGLTRVVCVCLLWLVVFLAPASASAYWPLEYLTEEYYPFNYTEESQVKGLSVEILHLVWAELGMKPQPIEVMPWARAYERARTVSTTVLFSMARTPQRENLFRWVGPIATVRFVLVAKKESNISIKRLEDAACFRIGTLRDDISDAILQAQPDFKRVEAVADMEQNILKLMDDRVDMVAYEESAWRKLAIRYKFSPDDFETVFLLRETPVYFAFNPDIPPTEAQRFQEGLDVIKTRPEYQRILDAYLR